jgi:hypothetical protein
MSRIPTPEAIVVPVQAMITAFYENRVDYLALEDLQQYFENDGWDALLAASYEVVLLNLSQLADEIFRDDLACECLGSKARGSLSQQERAVLQQVDGYFGGGEVGLRQGVQVLKLICEVKISAGG